jgi:hypothetical protein
MSEFRDVYRLPLSGGLGRFGGFIHAAGFDVGTALQPQQSILFRIGTASQNGRGQGERSWCGLHTMDPTNR